MPFINATQVRAGMIINFENELCRVIFVEHQTPGNLPARIVTKMKRLKDGINRENRFGSSEKIDKASLEQHTMEYLYEDGVFGAFAANVCKLPVSNSSVIIRAVRSTWEPHSFWTPRQRITPFLQKIPIFCDDFQKERFPDYYRLVTTDYISGKEPLEEALPSPAP